MFAVALGCIEEGNVLMTAKLHTIFSKIVSNVYCPKRPEFLEEGDQCFLKTHIYFRLGLCEWILEVHFLQVFLGCQLSIVQNIKNSIML